MSGLTPVTDLDSADPSSDSGFTHHTGGCSWGCTEPAGPQEPGQGLYPTWFNPRISEADQGDKVTGPVGKSSPLGTLEVTSHPERGLAQSRDTCRLRAGCSWDTHTNSTRSRYLHVPAPHVSGAPRSKRMRSHKTQWHPHRPRKSTLAVLLWVFSWSSAIRMLLFVDFYNSVSITIINFHFNFRKKGP